LPVCRLAGCWHYSPCFDNRQEIFVEFFSSIQLLLPTDRPTDVFGKEKNNVFGSKVVI
jgi:hypothetical protein